MSNQEYFFETQTVRGIKSRVTVKPLVPTIEVLRFDAVDAWYEVDYELADFRGLLNKKIFEHIITVHLHVPNSAIEANILELVRAKKGQFLLTVERNTGSGYQAYLTAGLRPDMITISESDYPKKITLRARGLEYHKSYPFTLYQETTMSSLIKAIAEALDSTLPIRTYNDWEIGAGTTDYFQMAYIDKYHLRNYQSRTFDEAFTKYEALYALIPDGFGLWQKNGAWHLFQIDYALRKGGVNLDVYRYLANGDFDEAGTVSIIDAISGAQNAVLPSSVNSYYANLKRITQRYTHNSLFSNLSFPFLIVNNNSAETKVFTFEVFGLAQQRIMLSVDARVITQQTDQMVGNARVTIEIGTLHYSDATQSWQTTGTAPAPINIPVAGNGGVLTGSKNIITVPIPQSVTDTEIKVTFRWASVINIGDPGSVVTINRVDFLNATGSVIAESTNNEFDIFQAFSDDDYLGQLQLPERIFGQGPHPFSRGAIRLSTNAIVSQWRIKGGTNRGYAAHIFDRTFALFDDAQVSNLVLYSDIPPPNFYQFDGRVYFGIAGRRNESEGIWEVFAIKGVPASRDFDSDVIPGPTPGPTPQLLTGEQFVDAKDVFDREYPLDLRTRYLQQDGSYSDEQKITIDPVEPIIEVLGQAAPPTDAFFRTNGVATINNGNRIEPFRHLDAFDTQQDNYNVGIGTTFTVQTDGLAQPDRTITGIAGGVDGRFIRIFNRGVDTVRIDYDSTDSDASNRIINGSGSAINLQTNECIQMIYDDSVSRWRIIHD